MIELEKLPQRERELLQEILKAKDINVTFPEDAPAREILSTTRLLTSVLGKIEKRTDEIKGLLVPVLGLLLKRARENREVLELAGCQTMAEFMDKEIRTKISKGSAYDASNIWGDFESAGLTPRQFKDIGISILSLAAKACPKDASDRQKEEILAIAESSDSVDDFKEKLHEKGLATHDQLTGAVLEIKGSLDKIKDVQRLLQDEVILSGAQSQQDIDKIIAALETARTEWMEERESDSGEPPDAS